MKRLMAATVLALMLSAGFPLTAGAVTPRPVDAHPVDTVHRDLTRTGAICWTGDIYVKYQQFLVPWAYMYWGLHVHWCSTSAQNGHISYYSQRHFTESLGQLTTDAGIKEDWGYYYSWVGKVHGGHYAHVKGELDNCFGGCQYFHPWVNLRVHRDGSWIIDKGKG